MPWLCATVQSKQYQQYLYVYSYILRIIHTYTSIGEFICSFLTLFHTQKQALVSSQDVQYADIDHMYKQMDFTIDHDRFPGLNAYFLGLQQKGMKTIIILVKSLIKF